MRMSFMPVLVLPLIACLSGAVAAQTFEELVCATHDPDASIRGCTAMIQSGQEPQENIAIAYYTPTPGEAEKPPCQASRLGFYRRHDPRRLPGQRIAQ